MKYALCPLLAAAALGLSAPASAGAPVYGYQVVHAYPHDTKASTEGLLYDGGYLYESTGINGQSELRKVDLATGAVIQRRDLANRYFAEGIALFGGKIVQLTYVSQTAFVYDETTFAPLGTFSYAGQGWGLTSDATRLVMSDGSSTLSFRDPGTFAEIGKVQVTDGGAPVNELNELEHVNGYVYANVYFTSDIAIIDPATGVVAAWVDLTGILGSTSGENAALGKIANGIAYDAAGDRLFVTGKDWPSVFQIEIVP